MVVYLRTLNKIAVFEEEWWKNKTEHAASATVLYLNQNLNAIALNKSMPYDAFIYTD